MFEIRRRHKSILLESLERWSEGADLSPPSRFSELESLKRGAVGLAGAVFVVVGLVCAGFSPMMGSSGSGGAAPILF